MIMVQQWMWNDALVAHKTLEREDLGLILIQTQDCIFNGKTLISLVLDSRLKQNSFICNIVMSSWNK
jgi:hypothetical protein